MLTGVFNSLVGLVFFRKLITGSLRGPGGAPIEPDYLPYHADGRGGYRDIGKLAMRINFIVIIAGVYYVHRAYVAGLRTSPSAPDPAFAPLYADTLGIAGAANLEAIFWSINYLGPVLLYILVVGFWFYYTFWEIHKRMRKLKRDTILRVQHHNRLNGKYPESPYVRTDAPSSRERPLGDLFDRTDLYDAPEWPVDSRRLGWILTGNVLPILLSVLTLLPEITN